MPIILLLIVAAKNRRVTFIWNADEEWLLVVFVVGYLCIDLRARGRSSNTMECEANPCRINYIIIISHLQLILCQVFSWIQIYFFGWQLFWTDFSIRLSEELAPTLSNSVLDLEWSCLTLSLIEYQSVKDGYLVVKGEVEWTTLKSK